MTCDGRMRARLAALHRRRARAPGAGAGERRSPPSWRRAPATATAAVLFYGSALRDEALDGVLDFYVLTDRPIAWPGSRWTALASRLLPPNVGYLETVDRRQRRCAPSTR